MTQMKEARKGNITKEVEIIANEEHISPEKLRKMIAIGKVVIPKNINRKTKPCGIGDDLKTKTMQTLDHQQKWKIYLLKLKKLKQQ